MVETPKNNLQVIIMRFRRDYTCRTWNGEDIVQTTNNYCWWRKS